MVSYLAGGTVLLAARHRGPDKVSGEAFRTPVGLATDGHVVWRLDAKYYAREYAIAPDPFDLVKVATARAGTCPEVSAERLAAVLRAVGIQQPPVS